MVKRADAAVTELQISPVIVDGFKKRFSPMDSAYFSGRSGGYLIFVRKFFFGFQNLYPLYRPVAGKPLVLEVLCLEVGTSVSSP